MSTERSFSFQSFSLLHNKQVDETLQLAAVHCCGFPQRSLPVQFNVIPFIKKKTNIGFLLLNLTNFVDLMLG